MLSSYLNPNFLAFPTDFRLRLLLRLLFFIEMVSRPHSFLPPDRHGLP